MASSPMCGQEAAWSGQADSMALVPVPVLVLVQVDTAGGLGCGCRCRCRVLASKVSDMGSALTPDLASKINPLPCEPYEARQRPGLEQATLATGSCQQEKQVHSWTGLTVTDAHRGRMQRVDKEGLGKFTRGGPAAVLAWLGVPSSPSQSSWSPEL
jgi:hypothetical protein